MTTWTRETTSGTSTENNVYEKLTVDSVVINGTNIGHADDLDLLALSSGTLTVNGNIAGTLTTAAQTNITSTGTLTALQVDNINLNLNTINATSGDLTITAAGGDISFGNDNITTTGWAAIGTATRKQSAYLTVQGNAPSIAMVSTATYDEGAQINFYGTTNSGGTDYSAYNTYLDAWRGQLRLIASTPGATLSATSMINTQPDTGDITNPAYSHLQLKGIGTIGQVKIESKLTLAAKTLVKRIESAAVTIASGVGNIVSGTHGSLVGFTSESSTSDDLDFVMVDGAEPADGTEIYVCSTASHDITVRTATHSGVTGAAGAFVGRDSDMTYVHSYVLNGSADGQKMIHCIYRGNRWVIISANCASRSLTS